jgi:hypothetical protein
MALECRGELAVSVADQEPEAACPVTEIHEQVAGLLGGPGSGGVSSYRDIAPIVWACRRPSMLAAPNRSRAALAGTTPDERKCQSEDS